MLPDNPLHTPEGLLQTIDGWVRHSWLRPLDRAFVLFLRKQQPDSPGLVLLAAALASHQLGRGHVCLDLRVALNQPDEALSLPPEGMENEPSIIRPSNLLAEIEYETWVRSLKDCTLVGSGDGDTPLVFNAGRLYLRRYWVYTRQVAAYIAARLDQRYAVPDDLSIRLDHMFTSLRTRAEQTKKQIHWQSVGAAIAAGSAFSIISGGPGTGKTTTVVHLLGLLQAVALEQEHPLRIRLAAPTGKAAARLTASMGHAVDQLPDNLFDVLPKEVMTLHRLLGSRPDTRHFVHNARNPLHLDLLVVDEASMIDLEMMAALLDALPAGARLILLGDKDQLASVEAGSVLGDLCRNASPDGYLPATAAWIEQYTGYTVKTSAGNGIALNQHIVVLQDNHRFGANSGIGALARAVNSGRPENVTAVLNHGFTDIAQAAVQDLEDDAYGRLVRDGHPDSASEQGIANGTKGYRAYLACINAGTKPDETEDEWLQRVFAAFNRFQILSPLRKGYWGVEHLNEQTAAVLFNAGLIPATSGWYPGRPVMATRNDYSLGLMNGDTGIVLPVWDQPERHAKSLKVVFPMADGTLKKVLPSRLNDVETVYAMTVHKSQGSEFDHTVLVFPDRMSPILTRELIYTAVTRSRRRFTLVGRQMELMPQTVKRRVLRASGLGERLG